LFFIRVLSLLEAVLVEVVEEEEEVVVVQVMAGASEQEVV
jgi:HSP20 family molecular chaperone IbpA